MAGELACSDGEEVDLHVVLAARAIRWSCMAVEGVEKPRVQPAELPSSGREAACAATVAVAGAEAVEEWLREGARHDASWALDHAIETLAGRRAAAG